MIKKIISIILQCQYTNTNIELNIIIGKHNKKYIRIFAINTCLVLTGAVFKIQNFFPSIEMLVDVEVIIVIANIDAIHKIVAIIDLPKVSAPLELKLKLNTTIIIHESIGPIITFIQYVGVPKNVFASFFKSAKIGLLPLVFFI